MKAKTKRQRGAKVQARAKPGTKRPAKASAGRRQLMDLCERVEELLLAMGGLAGGVLAWELSELSERLHEAVVAG